MLLTRITLIRRLLVVGVTLAVVTSVLAPAVGVAVAAPEEEPNDSRENAQSIPTGEEITGTTTSDDEDWFKFTAERGETINITAFSDSPVDIRLARPDGDFFTGTTVRSPPESIGTTARSSGTYYVRVTGNPSDYNFTVDTYETDPFEPNEDQDNATRLYENPFPDDRAQISIGDTDWFQFRAAQGETVTVTGAPATDRVTFRLYNAEGDTIDAMRPSGPPESIGTTAAYTGFHYLQVNAGGPGPIYNFTVEVPGQTLGLPNDEFEEPNPPVGNQDRANATDIEPGVYPDLAIVDDDRDVFAVDLAAGERVSAAIDFTHAENDLALAISDETGTTLTQADSGTDGEQLGFTAPSAGTYYLTVSGETDAAARYDLDLDVLRTVNVTVGPGSTSLPPSNTTTVTVSAANVGAGLSTANLTLTASNTSVVQIQSISAAGTGTVDSSISSGGETATVNVSSLDAAATGQVPLVEVTLASQANGTATLSGTATVTSATGATYPIGTVQETTVTVEPPTTVPPVVAEYDDDDSGTISNIELLDALADYPDQVGPIELLDLLAVYESGG